MVAFIPVLLSSIVGLFVAFSIFQPRLPKYSFRIHKLWPRLINRQFKAQLGAGVKLQNDNFVPIDIHALSFDLFYPDWKGNLHHIGNVHDTQQQHHQQQPPSPSSTSSSSTITKTPLPPLWALQPRQVFETNDSVFMQPSGGLSVLSSLSWDLVKQWGTVQVPSSGVIHVKANSRVPLTLSILCDNVLNTWTLEMQGLTCELDSIDLGWSSLPDTVERLRSKVVNTNGDVSYTNTNTNNAPDEESNKKLLSLVGKKKSPPPNFQDEYEKLARKSHWKSAISVFGLLGEDKKASNNEAVSS